MESTSTSMRSRQWEMLLLHPFGASYTQGMWQQGWDLCRAQQGRGERRGCC